MAGHVPRGHANSRYIAAGVLAACHHLIPGVLATKSIQIPQLRGKTSTTHLSRLPYVTLIAFGEGVVQLPPRKRTAGHSLFECASISEKSFPSHTLPQHCYRQHRRTTGLLETLRKWKNHEKKPLFVKDNGLSRHLFPLPCDVFVDSGR